MKNQVVRGFEALILSEKTTEKLAVCENRRRAGGREGKLWGLKGVGPGDQGVKKNGCKGK
jgi:hypothetical protein